MRNASGMKLVHLHNTAKKGRTKNIDHLPLTMIIWLGKSLRASQSTSHLNNKRLRPLATFLWWVLETILPEQINNVSSIKLWYWFMNTYLLMWGFIFIFHSQHYKSLNYVNVSNLLSLDSTLPQTKNWRHSALCSQRSITFRSRNEMNCFFKRVKLYYTVLFLRTTRYEFWDVFV